MVSVKAERYETANVRHPLAVVDIFYTVWHCEGAVDESTEPSLSATLVSHACRDRQGVVPRILLVLSAWMRGMGEPTGGTVVTVQLVRAR